MKKKVGMIIQARMSSTRFPGKVMKKLLNKPMIFRILERVKFCKRIDKLIVAIPTSKSDDILYDYLKSIRANVFRGSENNLLKRYYDTAKKYDLKYIVRLPADNPLPDYKEIDRLINFHMKLKNSINPFSSNLQPMQSSKYIDGVGAEIFSFKMLKLLIKNKHIQKSKEHLSLNFYDFDKDKQMNKKFFEVKYIKAPKSISYPNIALDVNYLRQFRLIKKIYKNLYKKRNVFLTKDIIKFLKKNEKKLFKNN